MFEETLGGRRLPVLTECVLKYRSVFVMLAVFVPCAALATFALEERWQAIAPLAGLLLLAACHIFAVHMALYLPTIPIVRMGGK